MRNVVFFGSIGIARRILDEIVLTHDVNLLGVCCQEMTNSWRDEESVFTYCKKRDIPIIEESLIPSLSPDLGISVRYNRIISQSVIGAFKQGVINTHGGILPEYRGSYCNINSLINEETEFGATLHYIEEGIDTGDIIAIKRVKINESDTGFDLYKTSERLCYELIEENLESVLNGNNKRIKQQELIQRGHFCREYKSQSTLSMKHIVLENVSNQSTLNIVRAFDSPMHEPAYTEICGRKIYMRVTK